SLVVSVSAARPSPGGRSRRARRVSSDAGALRRVGLEGESAARESTTFDTVLDADEGFDAQESRTRPCAGADCGRARRRFRPVVLQRCGDHERNRAGSAAAVSRSIFDRERGAALRSVGRETSRVRRLSAMTDGRRYALAPDAELTLTGDEAIILKLTDE